MNFLSKIEAPMKTLVPLIKVLRPGEVRLVKHFLKLETNAEVKKRLQLFELIVSGKVDTDKKALKKLYKTEKNNSAFSHLKERLRKDVLNVLFLQDASKKFSTKYANAEFECRRNFIQADILIARGAYNEGAQLLEKALEKAKKFELPIESILMEQLLRKMYHRIKSLKTLELYNQNIQKNIRFLEDLNKVEEFSNILAVPRLFKANPKFTSDEYKKEMIVELDKMYKRTNSAKIGFWYYMTANDYYSNQREFDEALKHNLSFLELIKNEPAVYSSANWAGANGYVAENFINTHAYEDAIGYAQIAVRNFKKDGINEFNALEVLFFAFYRSYQFEEAENILNKVFVHQRLKANAFYHAKWLYLRACLEFSKHEFSKALKTLNEITELNKDKSGWLLGLRMLELLIMVEKRDFDWFDFKLENFRKLLQRQKLENIQRSKVIFNVLKTLSKTEFDFFETMEKEKENIRLLEEAQNEFYWDPKGFEVIRFDDWLKSKVDSF